MFINNNNNNNNNKNKDFNKFNTNLLNTLLVAFYNSSSNFKYKTIKKIKYILQKDILINNTCKFIPSHNQSILLEENIKSQSIINFGKLSNKEWYKLFWDTNGGVLFDVLGHESKQIFRDQMIRAKFLANQLINKNIYEIYILDGHGRFILCLFHFLYKNDYDINRLDLNICDINPFAHKWHELFLPKNVSAIPKNILDIAAEISMDYDELPFLYLNFCALGPTLKDNIYSSVNNEETLKNIIKLFSNNLMISYSVRGTKKDGFVGNFINEIENDYNIIKVSHRKKFHTIFINYN
jgi:hypothetical protein